MCESTCSEAGPASGRGTAKSGGAGLAVAESSKLDKRRLKGTTDCGGGRVRRRLVVVGCSCGRWACCSCGVRYWARVRSRVLPHLHLFGRGRLLTLTVDRKRFQSGQAAYEYVQGKGYIRRFLRLMGFRKAFSVLAFHVKVDQAGRDGREWPHWHIVVDLDDCGSRVDLKRAWRLWRDQWGVGGLQLGINRKFRDAASAVGYAVSYCQHQSGVVASWAVEGALPRAFETYGRLRFAVRACGRRAELSPAEAEAEAVERAVQFGLASEAAADRLPRRRRSAAEAIAECRKVGVVLRETVYPNGERFYKYVDQVAASPERLALLGKLGVVDGLTVETVEGESYAGLRVYIGDDVRDEEYAVEMVKLAVRRLGSGDDVQGGGGWPAGGGGGGDLTGQQWGEGGAGCGGASPAGFLPGAGAGAGLSGCESEGAWSEGVEVFEGDVPF